MNESAKLIFFYNFANCSKTKPMSVTIVEVKTKKQLKAFVKFPDKLYKDDPLYVPALQFDEMNTLQKKSNPAFDFCDAVYFLAYKGEEIVGRIAGIINRKANDEWKEKIVRFGWIDFIDDMDVSSALIDKVIEWGKKQGMVYIKGPLGFSDMDKEGMLVEGFDKLPSITCIYNFPYYPEHLEKLGFKKDVDWTQSIMKFTEKVPPQFSTYNDLIEKRFNVHLVTLKTRKDKMKKGHEMFKIINEAFLDNKLYEFTTLSERQIDMYVKQYVPLINKKLVSFVEDKDNRTVGFVLTMPQMSNALQKAKGRIFPFGFIHLLRALRLKSTNTIEALMIGIIPEYQGKGVHALMFNQLQTNAYKLGARLMITNPQLEENAKVQTVFANAYEIKPYIRRRSYVKEI